MFKAYPRLDKYLHIRTNSMKKNNYIRSRETNKSSEGATTTTIKYQPPTKFFFQYRIKKHPQFVLYYYLMEI